MPLRSGNLLAAAAFVVLCLAVNYPGLHDADWAGLLTMARTLPLDQWSNWHPPLFTLFLFLCDHVSPAAAYVAQAALFAAGFYVIARAARGALPALLVWAVALSPFGIFLAREVTKDGLMTALLLIACGLVGLQWRQERASAGIAAALLASVALALGMRHNAIFAAAPVCIAYALRFMPPGRALIAGSVGSLALALSLGAAVTTFMRPLDGDPFQSLILFDIAGTAHNLPPGALVEPRVMATLGKIDECYTPGYTDPVMVCHSPMLKLVNQTLFPRERKWLWAQVIATYPGAYLRHRIEHFKWFLGFVSPFSGERQRVSAAHNYEPPDQQPPTHLIARAYQWAGEAMFRALYWPWAWFLVLLVVPAATMLLPPQDRSLPLTLAAAGFAYGAAFFFVSVAPLHRYMLFTTLAGALAAATLPLGMRGGRSSRERLLLRGRQEAGEQRGALDVKLAARVPGRSADAQGREAGWD